MDANAFVCAVAYVDKPLTDGDRGISVGFSDGVEFPYNKLTKFKLCTDELDDSSSSFIIGFGADLIGDFDRFACKINLKKNTMDLLLMNDFLSLNFRLLLLLHFEPTEIESVAL